GGDTEQILSTVHRVTDDTLRGTDRFASHVLDAVDQALDDVLARAVQKRTEVPQPGLDLAGELAHIAQQGADLADDTAHQALERADRDLLRSVEARLDGAADRGDPADD